MIMPLRSFTITPQFGAKTENLMLPRATPSFTSFCSLLSKPKMYILGTHNGMNNLTFYRSIP